MAAIASTMLPLGTPLPEFSLHDFDGKLVSSNDFNDAQGLVVAFICNHCPFVRHARKEFAKFARDYQPKNIEILAIASNDIKTFPQDGVDGMKSEAREAGYSFPYIFDDTQAVAKAFHAACTPDFYLFDKNQRLIYRGQFDDSRPGNNLVVSGKDLRAACDALLANKAVPAEQKPSIGCNIKWRTGNEPEYAR